MASDLELSNTPSNWTDHVPHHRWHHSFKKCKVEMTVDGNLTNKFCITHQKLCSKSGWEIGWHRGNNSSKIYTADDNKICQDCGEEFLSANPTSLRCKKCRHQRQVDLTAKANYERKLKKNGFVDPKSYPQVAR